MWKWLKLCNDCNDQNDCKWEYVIVKIIWNWENVIVKISVIEKMCENDWNWENIIVKMIGSVKMIVTLKAK